MYVLPECCGEGYSRENTQPLGGRDVERDLVPKHVGVRSGNASPIGEEVPMQGISRVCWCQGSSHVLVFLLLPVLVSSPLPRLLPTTVTLTLFRAAPAALMAAESTQASLYLLVCHCVVSLQVFCTKFRMTAEHVGNLVGRKLVLLPSWVTAVSWKLQIASKKVQVKFLA